MTIERIDAVKPIETARKIVDSALRFQHNLEYVRAVRGLVRFTSPEHEGLGLSVHTKIAAVHGFVAQKMSYIRDPRGIELHFSPENIFRRILEGEIVMEDCDSYAGMVLAMLWALGLRARLVIVGYSKPKPLQPPMYQHVFAECWQPATKETKARWVIVDPSMGKNVRAMARMIRVARIFDPFAARTRPQKLEQRR